MDFTPVPFIDAKAANEITTPITIFAAQNDILFPGNKMIKRAAKIFPSLKKAHFLNIRNMFKTKNKMNRLNKRS